MQSIGKYEVLTTLGKGASSQILKVRRFADNKSYALKVVTMTSPDDRKFIDQAEHEFQVGSRFDNPRLEKVYCFEKQTKFFRVIGAHLLLEFIDGKPLNQCKQLPMHRLATIFFQVADGLTYMHNKGVFHADIKPDNVMVTSTADAKIIDFGLAWFQGDKKDRVQGTLEYLAPEQARKKIVNAKTDIFNLGATMYRVLTGKPVPSQLRESDMRRVGGMDQLVERMATFHRETPEELNALVFECLRHDPNQRPKEMKEVRDRLRSIAHCLRTQAKENNQSD